MVRVSKKKRQNKYGKHVIKQKRIESHAGHNSTAFQKDQKKILTNARLTVSHMQTGIFMKGMKSSTYHREGEVNFNILNKARMNEKLNEILGLAKISDKSIQDTAHDSVNHISDIQSCLLPRNSNVEKEFCSDSSPSLITKEHYERREPHKVINRHPEEESSSADETEIPRKQNTFENSSLYPHETHNEDSDYADFKMFITHFDNIIFLKPDFTVDFIATEKQNIRKKQRNHSLYHSSVNPSPDAKRGEAAVSDHPQNPDDSKKEENGTRSTYNNSRHRISRSKRNPNYNAFKNIEKVQIINTSLGQQRNPEELKSRNIFSQCDLPGNPHKEYKFHNDEKLFSSNDEHIFTKTNNSTTKSSLLNPLNFLTSSLSKNDNYSFSSLSTKSSLDGFQFLKHSLNQSCFSAPAELKNSSEHRTESPFKAFSQPLKSQCENERRVNYKNSESPRICKPSPIKFNIWEDHVKSYSEQHNKEDDIFEFFGEENKAPVSDVYQVRVDFPNDNNSPMGFSDSKNGFYHSCGSQSVKPENILSFPDETIIDSNKVLSPIYSQKVTKTGLESPVLEVTSKGHRRENTDNLPLYSSNYPTFHRTKIDISPISNIQEVDIRANNFWYRRKMF